MKNKIKICEKFIKLCKENIKELELIKSMSEKDLIEARKIKEYANAKVFLKLVRESDAMIVQQREGVQFWEKRLNAIKKIENDK